MAPNLIFIQHGLVPLLLDCLGAERRGSIQESITMLLDSIKITAFSTIKWILYLHQ